jgi:hypothetical protein
MDKEFILFLAGLLLGYGIGAFVLLLITRAERKHGK